MSWPEEIKIKHISVICSYQIEGENLDKSHVEENPLN